MPEFILDQPEDESFEAYKEWITQATILFGGDMADITEDELRQGWMEFWEITEATKGGPGSGNYGHEGRPGEVGGSAPGDGGGGTFSQRMKKSNLRDWNKQQMDIMVKIGISDPDDAVELGMMFAKVADEKGAMPTAEEFIVYWKKRSKRSHD